MIDTATAVTGPRPTPHRMGMLFEILDEMGEDPTFTFELARVGGGAPIAAVDIKHAESDGFGGLTRFLRQQGISFEAPAQRTAAAPPSLLSRMSSLYRVVRHRPASPLVLRASGAAWTAGARVTARPHAGRLLSAEASARAFASARAVGASVSSYLLHALTETVVPAIAEPSASVTWGVPVNMRGPVRVVPDEANCSSIMPVDVPRGGSAFAVHQALAAALAADLHWGKWDQLNTAARFGRRALKNKISRYYRTAGAARIGVFSNVGVWKGDTAPDVGVIGFGVPMLPDPIFATMVTWNGKLGLSLRAHPSLTADPAVVARWMDAWLDRIAP